MLLTFYLLFIGLHVSEGCDLVNREQLLSITAHTGGSVLLPCYCTDQHTTPEGFSWKKDNMKTEKREVISSESGQYRDRVQLFNGHSPGNLSLLISHLTEEDGGDYWCAVKGAHLTIRLTLKEGPPQTTPPTAVVSVHTRPTTSTTHSSQKPDKGPPQTTPPTAVVSVHTSPTTSTTHSPQRPDKDPAKPITSTAVVRSQSSLSSSVAGFPRTPDDTGYSTYFFIFIPALLLLLGFGGFIYWRYRGQRRGQTESQEERRTKTEEKTQDEVMYSTVVHSNTTTTTTTVTDIEEKAEYATIRVN
ncbi:hypothetical protein MHYP_G00050300 [Metynnis hypsauchen]